MFELILLLSLLIVGYGFGSYREKQHYKSIFEREETLIDLMKEIKEMNHLKQIEFLENKVAKNLDEASYSELIKLKSQLNRQ